MSKYFTKNTLIIAGAIAGILWAAFVWPTQWKEYRKGQTIMRVHRITGAVQYLRGAGWEY